MIDLIYKKSFSNFLKNTNEKQVVRAVIEDEIKNNVINSVLDIGGGMGDMIVNFIKYGAKTTVIEPNIAFSRHLKSIGVEHIKDSWEKVCVETSYDLILALWVVNYFDQTRLSELINKMFSKLNRPGTLIIVVVDPQKGTWRKVHNYLYSLIGIFTQPVACSLKPILSKYKFIRKEIITKVRVKYSIDMINILKFDFHKYKNYFRHYKKLENYLNSFKNNNSEIELTMVNQMYIIRQK